VAVVGRLLDEHQVAGGGQPRLPPVQPQPPAPRGLHPGGVRILLSEVVADFPERSQLLPASDEGAGARETVAFTRDLHAVNNRPAAGLVVVEVHHLASAVQSPRNLIGFSLTDIDKVLSKFVAVLNVVAAASPDPGGLEVLGPLGARAAAAGELTVPAAAGHGVDHARARHRVGEGRLLGRDAEHGPEHGCVLDRGAVPPVVPELPLTLPDAVPGAPAHVDHVVSVEAAQLLLALGQPLDPGAQGAGVGAHRVAE